MNLENLKSFFTQLFTEIDTDDSIYILLFLTVAYLLGLLFGAMSRNRKIRRLTKMVKDRDNDLITVRAENGALKEKLEISDERVQQLETDYETTNSLLGEMEENRNAMHFELTEAKELVGRLSAQNSSNEEEVLRLTRALEEIAAGNTTSTHIHSGDGDSSSTGSSSVDTSDHSSTSTSSDSDRLAKLEARLSDLAEENIHLNSQLIDLKGQSSLGNDNSLAAIKARLEQVELENDRLQKDLLGIKGGSTPITVFDNSTSNDANATVIGSELSAQEREAKARAALNAAFGGKLKKETAENKSNLKLIAGIGPFIENKLNDIGIYSFEQISQLDEELIGYITDAIQFFPGRIQRDDWVGQAKKLL